MTEPSDGLERWLFESNTRFAQWKNAYLQQLAGQELPLMLASRKVTEKLLESPDSNLRIAALSLFLDHWKPEAVSISKIEHMVLADPVADVQASAIGALSHYYARTSDSRFTTLLKQIVLKNQQNPKTREAAYYGLLIVRGEPLEKWPSAPPGEFRFPDDVDWALVNSL